MVKQTIAVLGAGSWGTAIAIHLARGGYSVVLWGRRSEHVEAMKTARSNEAFLPGSPFPKTLTVVSGLDEAVASADDVMIAVPSHAFGSILEALKNPPLKGLAWLTKGLDPKTHAFLSQCVAEKWGIDYPMALISGPSFAKEVANDLPTALVIASRCSDYASRMRALLHHHHMRVYLSADLIGVQLCGAVKNVLAIACGISDGLAFGANARAALITRGLAEMTRLGRALGAQDQTFMGLAGVGDLVLTCTDDQSRNRRFGLLLGQGMTRDNAERHVQQVVEGCYNAAQVCALANAHQVDMPICAAVYAILNDEVSATEAASLLINRPHRE